MGLVLHTAPSILHNSWVVNARTHSAHCALTSSNELWYPGFMVIDTLVPRSEEQAENDALSSLLNQFDGEGSDTRKVDYLKHRYAGFRRKEAATIAGLTIATINKWLKDDPRVAEFDNLVTTEKRKPLRKEVLQEEWYRNFYLVMQKDAYVLRKAHGLLEETILSIDSHGKQTRRVGSPVMQKADWDYYAQMRKMYTPEAWASIEKAMAGQTTTFNIAEFVLNMGHNQQVNLNAS